MLKICVLFCVFTKILCTAYKEDPRVFVMTVTGEETDGYKRFLRSAEFFKISVNTLGLGQNITGGGHKLKILKETLEPAKSYGNTIIIITDNSDVVFLQTIPYIIEKFLKTDAKVLFAVEGDCWPDSSLANKYPDYLNNRPRFLNSGLIIGFVKELVEILNIREIEDTENDQSYFTQIFLNPEYRKKFGMQLDYKSYVLLNLNAADDTYYTVKEGYGFVSNSLYNTNAFIVQGGRDKNILFNSMANYFAGTFVANECNICNENLIELEEDNLPQVTIGIFAEKLIHNFPAALEKIAYLNYPKHKMTLYIHCSIYDHDQILMDYFENFRTEYKAYRYMLRRQHNINEEEGREYIYKEAIKRNSDYIFVVENYVELSNPNVLRELLAYNKSFIAPLLVKKNTVESNFWGALNSEGYYARSHDYMDIVNRNVKGMWNVPYISSCYLMKKSVFSKIKFSNKEVDMDMSLCEDLRNAGVFMNIVNKNYYGRLMSEDDINEMSPTPMLYTLLSNQGAWEERYIHPDYWKNFDIGVAHKEICPDVYKFPLVTEQFCDDMVEAMEFYGQWSGGSNEDDRILGGYENVPTRDIHMYQVGLDEIWMTFLDLYVKPLQQLVFYGFNEPIDTFMKFVVRYRPDEQPFLRPHNDASTYTINIALNQVDKDYTGGGCNFVRYDCAIRDTKKGWVLMHPGRVTHMHEGLNTTGGIRYILITFINP